MSYQSSESPTAAATPPTAKPKARRYPSTGRFRSVPRLRRVRRKCRSRFRPCARSRLPCEAYAAPPDGARQKNGRDPHPAGQKGNSPDCKSHCRNNLVHNRHNWTLCRYIHCCLGAICKRFFLRQ